MGGFSDVITNAGENGVSDLHKTNSIENQVYFINKFDVQVVAVSGAIGKQLFSVG